MKTVRNYNKFVTSIINLSLPLYTEIMGYVTYDKEIFPILVLKSQSKKAGKNIVIMSGMHGEEAYGTQIVLKFLQQLKVEEYLNFNFTIFPCINPFGYAYNRRQNGYKQQLNEDADFVKDSKIPELKILFENIPNMVDLYLDIHGDDEEFVYMYEKKPNELPSIAEKALLENDHILPFNKSEIILIDKRWKNKAHNGVIATSERDTGIEAKMEALGTEYTVTLELPGKYKGQERAIGGVAILNSVLRNFRDLDKKEIK